MSLVTSGASHWRNFFKGSQEVWRERLIGLALAVSAAGLIYLSGTVLALWQATILWAIFCLTLAVCSRQGWIKLFGPVLFYDMLRTARRSRYIIMRLLYAMLLLGILGMMYLNLYLESEIHRRMDRFDTAVLAQTFFLVFMIVQLCIVVLLTPAYVAGAIAEEKDRKTLEFLLATDLRNREIVLSKFLSRLANMTLLLLTGLPILSMLQFIGGVDPQLVIAGFAGTGLTMLGIASLSILFSTLFKKPRDAIGITYLFIITYLGAGLVALVMEEARYLILDPIWDSPTAPTWQEVADVVNAGNPVTAMLDIGLAIEGHTRAAGRMAARTSLAAELPGILERYAWFHLLVSLVLVIWSILRLRAVALRQGSGGSTAKLRWYERWRPPVGEYPMLWKEMHIEGRARFNWYAMIAGFLLVAMTLGSGLLVLGHHLWEYAFGGRVLLHELPENMNHWFRVAGTVVGCLMIIMVAVRVSTTITHERERDTFDALIATPMSAENMLLAKLIGNLTGMRLAWIWLGSLLVLALLTGGIHVCAVPIVVTAWGIYVVFFTMVGMWYSMVCKSSMRATVFTVVTTLGLGGGHWLITGMCCMPVLAFMEMHHPGDFPLYFIKFQAGITPPAVLAFCAYSWEDMAHHFRHSELVELIVFCLVGLFLWTVASLTMWFAILLPKFQQITRREDLLYE